MQFLILILVELDFWDEKGNVIGCKSLLNPYSGGTWFLSRRHLMRCSVQLILNPYSGGTWFLRILILILIDNFKVLNPYSGGTWFLRTKNRFRWFCFEVFLILILVELDFWDKQNRRNRRSLAFLILILVELDFWVASKRGCLPCYDFLNPYSGGTWFLSLPELK